MKNLKLRKTIRKTHRYLGIFLGLQFLLWTVSGLYFSWTDIHEIRGNHFKKDKLPPITFNELLPIDSLRLEEGVSTIELRPIAGKAYYWINEAHLIDAKTGEIKDGVSEEEAIQIAKWHIIDSLQVGDIQLLTETNKHSEYRSKPLPVYQISFEHKDQVIAYVSKNDGKFQAVRHNKWRWFDFLWMTHTMDYKSKDNFNTLVLRIFSLLGVLTVISGFVLWGTTARFFQ